MKSNLPPGCTDKMIEDQCGEPCKKCYGEGFLYDMYEGIEVMKGKCRHCSGTGIEPDSEKPTRDEMREYYQHEDHT